uniref:ZP domain-containing protein n=1 Tax=Erpetoichthys calabaricus TaxID=27687 RepID=A0A8C4SAU0_ERPCA
LEEDWAALLISWHFELLISLQASVDNTNHLLLQVFVDNCVASGGTAPTYIFISNNGVDPSTIQFELDAFRFCGVAYKLSKSMQIFITCSLKAILASQDIDSLNMLFCRINYCATVLHGRQRAEKPKSRHRRSGSCLSMASGEGPFSFCNAKGSSILVLGSVLSVLALACTALLGFFSCCKQTSKNTG